MDEESFDKYIYRAQRSVLKRLKIDYDDFTEDQQADVKDCICDLINRVYSVSTASSGVSSISNDGYSETYIQTTADGEQKTIDSIIAEWLGGLGIMKQRFIAY